MCLLDVATSSHIIDLLKAADFEEASEDVKLVQGPCTNNTSGNVSDERSVLFEKTLISSYKNNSIMSLNSFHCA